MLEAPFDLEDRKVSTTWVVSSKKSDDAEELFQTEMFKAFCGWPDYDVQFDALECGTASAIAHISMDDFHERDFGKTIDSAIAPNLWHTKKAFVRGTDMGFSAWRSFEPKSNEYDHYKPGDVRKFYVEFAVDEPATVEGRTQISELNLPTAKHLNDIVVETIRHG